MKWIVVFLLFFPLALIGQTGGISIEDKLLTLKEIKNGALRIRTELKASSQDTILIYLEKVERGNITNLQTIESAYSFPLEITQNSINDQVGILVKYDLAVRSGNQFLFLLNEETGRLEPIDGFWNLGMIQTVEYKGKIFNYSYASCGCADNCWKSILFEVKDFKLKSISSLACDCQNLIKTNGAEDIETLAKCKEFNTPEKFERIQEYWKSFIIELQR
ncbi:hypothetical protein [uncultured Roseivirga sp.]|uniref:hypothetical protein n=1 Tax=uncultured Roseivirga sp. TaxID=543088 RepID=UPI000D795169|nr:hypothetical protein [uncultured Roseivirga sp.]PWL30753.1 MAG: hypothetical protein DCO95_04550 [Roseivirga sp. XM-24bin3]